MVATAVSLETHALDDAAVPLPVNCKVSFSQTVVSPEIVGREFTVMDIVAEFAH